MFYMTAILFTRHNAIKFGMAGYSSLINVSYLILYQLYPPTKYITLLIVIRAFVNKDKMTNF
jgi:branched-subunit amino acid permease